MTESAPTRHHFRPQWALGQLPGNRGEAWRVRFEDFSDDFATWVIFYGPPGGE